MPLPKRRPNYHRDYSLLWLLVPPLATLAALLWFHYPR